MSIYKRIAAALTAAAVMLITCGCSFNSDEDKVISMDVESAPSTIDPQLAHSDSELIVIRNTMTGLFRIAADGSAEQSLCESYTVSDDSITYTFKVKSAKWSNGDDITADDFVFGITRALLPETKSPFASNLFCIKNGEKVYSGELDRSQLGISATDGRTVKITLEAKTPDLIYRLADSAAMPCNRAFFNECKGKYGLSDDDMIYCGPFYVRSWDKTGLRMSRNSDYVAGKAKPSAVTMTFEYTSDERIDAITKGVIDIAVIDAESEIKAKSAGLSTESIHNIVWTIIVNPESNIAKTSSGASALMKSLDRTVIEGVLPSGYSMFSGLIAPHQSVGGKRYVDYVNEYTQQSMDAAAAKQEYMQAVKENGDIGGSTLLYVDQGQMNSVALKIASCWQKNLDAYINTEGVTIEQMQKRIADGDYTVALYPIGYGKTTAKSVMEQFVGNGNDNIFGINDTEFDGIMSSVEQCSDAGSKLAALLKSAETRLISTDLVCPVAISPLVATYTPTMTGQIFDLYHGNFDFAATGK